MRKNLNKRKLINHNKFQKNLGLIKTVNLCKTHYILITILFSLIPIIPILWPVFLKPYYIYQDHIHQIDEFYTDIWTNPSEGCIEKDCHMGNDPTRPIILELHVEDGKITGTLDASEWLLQADNNQKSKEKENEEFKNFLRAIHGFLLVEGETSPFSNGRIYITDYIEGERVLYGIANLTKKDNTLHMEMDGKHFLGIPSTATLYKSGSSCYDVSKDTNWLCNDKLRQKY